MYKYAYLGAPTYALPLSFAHAIALESYDGPSPFVAAKEPCVSVLAEMHALAICGGGGFLLHTARPQGYSTMADVVVVANHLPTIKKRKRRKFSTSPWA